MRSPRPTSRLDASGCTLVRAFLRPIVPHVMQVRRMQWRQRLEQQLTNEAQAADLRSDTIMGLLRPDTIMGLLR